MTDTQNEVFKTPVNKIRLFEHGLRVRRTLSLQENITLKDIPDGKVKHMSGNITNPDIVHIALMDGHCCSTDRQKFRQY